jgi:hydrogenase expression/formation protein HypD
MMVLQQLENRQFEVQNAYSRAVTFEGNKAAQEMINRVFKPVDRQWRGIGVIPQSGWGLRESFEEFDAEKRFESTHIQTKESDICIAGQILQGLKKPYDCPAFGTLCTPRNPLGATMVSSEGACARLLSIRPKSRRHLKEPLLIHDNSLRQ